MLHASSAVVGNVSFYGRSRRRLIACNVHPNWRAAQTDPFQFQLHQLGWVSDGWLGTLCPFLGRVFNGHPTMPWEKCIFSIELSFGLITGSQFYNGGALSLSVGVRCNNYDSMLYVYTSIACSKVHNAVVKNAFLSGTLSPFDNKLRSICCSGGCYQVTTCVVDRCTSIHETKK